LQQGETPGDQIPGTQYTVFKVRIKNSDIAKGKSGGYRVIYYVKTSEWVVLITIYAKTEQSDISPEIIKQIIDDYKLPEDD
jgi:mRNA-degrading endonuclease RelE of RelBE toxin-antitoxin system